MSKNSLQKWLGVLKWVLALGMLAFVLKSGKISFTDLRTFLASPGPALLCLALIFGQQALGFARWRLLLGGVGVEFRYFTCLQLGMLGNFFNAILPGTTGGDLVKAVYVARRHPDAKVKAVASILLDRIVGLVAMFLVGGVAFASSAAKLVQLVSPQARLVVGLGWVVATVAAGVLVTLALLPVWGRWIPARLPDWVDRLPLASLWHSLYEIVTIYKKQGGLLWRALGLSSVIHVINMVVLLIVAHTVFGPSPWGAVDVGTFGIAAVLGLCAQAIPVAPMGLGVGQVAFAAIFTALGAPAASFGATIVTALQLLAITVNLSGFVFFATYKNEIAAAREQEEAQGATAS